MLFRAGVPRHAIIKKFAGEDITKLDDFISVLSKLSRGARVPLEYISYTDRHRRKVLLVPLKYIVGYSLFQRLLNKLVMCQLVIRIYPCPSSGSYCSSKINSVPFSLRTDVLCFLIASKKLASTGDS